MALIVLIPVLFVVALVLVKSPRSALAVIGVVVLLAAGAVLFYVRSAVPQGATVIPVKTPEPPFLATAQMRAESASGRAQASIILEIPTTSPSEPQTDKLWVRNWPKFVNESKGQRRQQWLHAGTTELCATEAEARQQARTQAALLLAPRVAGEVRAALRAVPGTNLIVTNQWIIDRLDQALRADTLVADEYVRRIDRPYADVWSCELLLDGSPAAIAPVVSRYRNEARRELESAAVSWGSLAALGVLIVLTYAFLNWVTKGYFVWRLRAAAVGVVIVAVLVLMAVA